MLLQYVLIGRHYKKNLAETVSGTGYIFTLLLWTTLPVPRDKTILIVEFRPFLESPRRSQSYTNPNVSAKSMEEHMSRRPMAASYLSRLNYTFCTAERTRNVNEYEYVTNKEFALSHVKFLLSCFVYTYELFTCML